MSVTALTIGIAVIIIVAAALIAYMSSLVKNAYEIKVQMQADMEDGMKRIEQDVEKKLQWIKRDLSEQAEKARSSIEERHQHLREELRGEIKAANDLLEQEYGAERTEVIRMVSALTADLARVKQSLSARSHSPQPRDASTAEAQGECGEADASGGRTGPS